MKNKKKLEEFNDIYNNTYKKILGYIILHCGNLEDVNDLIQETYIELYKMLNKNCWKNKENDISKYIIGISKNILKKYYRHKYKFNKVFSIHEYWENNNEVFVDLDNNLEFDFITKSNVNDIWKYIEEKDIKVAKVFYCYYFLDMKLKEIAYEMNMKESTVKSYIYRTIQDLKKKFNKESD